MLASGLLWKRLRGLVVAAAVGIVLLPVFAAPIAVFGLGALVAALPSAATNCIEAAEGAPASDGTVLFPLPAGTWSVTSPYGMRVHPVHGTVRMHNGTDFGAAEGTAIVSIMDGVVADVAFPRSGDNYVAIESVDAAGVNIRTIYMHMWADGIFVQPGQQVRAGDVIGTVGNAGTSTGAHLHFEAWVEGKRVDPVPFLASYGALEVADCELIQS
jgi:murein DD-endopeptidase MepM/ murein hydrolase activator NlpD